MARHITEEGRKFIELEEGLSLKAYHGGADVAGLYTIGYGHTSAAGLPKVVAGMVITKDQADQILASDLGSVETSIERLVKVPLNDNQFDMLGSFTFNCGEGALAGSTLLRKLNAGNYDAVPTELMKWVNSNGQRQPGLVARRAREGAYWSRAVVVVPGAKPDPKPVEEAPAPIATKPGQVNIVGFGGLGGNVYSAGIKTMILRAKTIEQVDYAEYFPYESAQRVLATIATWHDPTIILGHSYGFNNFLTAMRAQKSLHIPLFFGMDSSQYWYGGGPGTIPDSVARVVNFYESSIWPLAIHGQPVYRADGSTRGIENIRVADSHINIDDDPNVQARFLTELKKEIGV